MSGLQVGLIAAIPPLVARIADIAIRANMTGTKAR
jgi:hypothetical protein